MPSVKGAYVDVHAYTLHLQVPRYLIIAGLMVGVVSSALIGAAPFITTPYEL